MTASSPGGRGAAQPPVALVVLALTGFAANSLLCRVALRPPPLLDAVSFTSIRLVSGAVVLAIVAAIRNRGKARGGNWSSALALFAYAICFSVAYVRITAGTGALLLFAAVQLTMLAAGIRAGERMNRLQWIGFTMAIAGLVILSWRGITAPDPPSAILMTGAGVAWGIYSLRGRGSSQPIGDTAGNFARAVPFALILLVVLFRGVHLSTAGILYAAASGGIASGLVYSVWYAALPRMTATSASVVQLSVPVIAAAGGVAFLGERPTMRLFLATVTILSGVALAILSRRRSISVSTPAAPSRILERS